MIFGHEDHVAISANCSKSFMPPGFARLRRVWQDDPCRETTGHGQGASPEPVVPSLGGFELPVGDILHLGYTLEAINRAEAGPNLN